MRGKRSGALALDEIVKFLPQAIVAIAAAIVLVGIINISFVLKTSLEERDLAMIVRELKDLGPKDEFVIPATALRSPSANDTRGLIVKLFKERDKEAPPHCFGKPCVCAYSEKGDPIKCEVLKLRPCRTNIASCARDPCVKRSQTVTVQRDKPFVLCRKCGGELGIGAASC